LIFMGELAALNAYAGEVIEDLAELEEEKLK
jgi:hypothetical protein